MNNVSVEEIAAGWQQRWFAAAIQNSLGEGEGGQHLHIKLRLCSSKEEWGRTENGSYLNSSRSWDESASKHGFTMIWVPSSFSSLDPKGKEGRREERRGGNWGAGAALVITSWPVRVACYSDALCEFDTHIRTFFPPSLPPFFPPSLSLTIFEDAWTFLLLSGFWKCLLIAWPRGTAYQLDPCNSSTGRPPPPTPPPAFILDV